MDSDLRNKLSRIVVKSFLLEVLKDDELEDTEKVKLRSLIKATKLSKNALSEIQAEVKEYTRDNYRPERLDERSYFKKLKGLIEIELDSKANQIFLQKIAKIIQSDESLIKSYIPSLFSDPSIPNTELMVQGPLNTSENSIYLNQRDRENSNCDNSGEILDSLTLLRDEVPSETIKQFDLIILYKSHGKHGDALEELLDYSNSLGYGIRNLLLSRMYYEIHNLKKAEECLIKAQKSGIPEDILLQESYFHKYETRSIEENIKIWQDLFNSQNYFSGSKSSKKCLESLRSLLVERNKNLLAVELTEFLITNPESLDISDQRECLNELQRLFSDIYLDIYFKYYGKAIISLQLLASCLILGICFYNVDKIGPAFFEILHQIVASIPDPELFKESLKKVLPFSFLVIALVPVCYVNGIMLWAGIQNKTKSYTQLHDKFIKICDFGRVYHLAITDPKKPIFLYQDDNDYTYVSLVRHLPLIPNFTYIYGYDQLRNIYCLLPLYGIADGYLFNKQFLRQKDGEVHPMNMLGVRLAQAATVVAKLGRTHLIAAPLIIFMGVFFYANISFISEASLKSYLVTFIMFLLSFIILIGLPQITTKLMRIKYLNFLLTVNIIKPGLLFLMALYLVGHYSHFGWLGAIPISVGLYSFYLIFIKTKYPSEKKQIVAQVSSSNVENEFKDEPIALAHGLRAIHLGDEIKSSKSSLFLFYSKDHIALSRKIYGLTLYYDVVNITSNFNIFIKESSAGSKLRISTYNYEVNKKIDEVKKILKKAQLPFEVKDFTERDRSKIAFNQLGVCCLIWVFWQFGSGLIWKDFKPKSLRPVNTVDALEKVVKYLYLVKDEKESSNFILKHNQEDLQYKVKIDSKTRLVTYHQANVMNWYQYETALQKGLALSDTSPIQLEVFKSSLPSFIKADGFRDDVFEFFGWHLWTRWKDIDSKKYARSIVEYCPMFGSEAAKIEDALVCSYSFSFEQAMHWIENKKSIPEQLTKELLVELLKVDGKLIAHYPPFTKNDELFVKTAVNQNGLSLEHVASKWQSDRDTVLLALKQDPGSHEFMKGELWHDRELMMIVLSTAGHLLKDNRTPESIKSQPELVIAAMRQDPGLVRTIYRNQSVENVMPQKLLSDSTVVKEILSQNGLMMKLLDSGFQNNEELAKVALRNNGMSLEFVSEEIKSSPKLVKIALQQNAMAHRFMALDLWNESDLLKLILAFDGMQLQMVPSSLLSNRDLTLIAVSENSRASQFMDEKFWDDTEIVKNLVSNNGLYLEYVSENLRNNRDILKTAVHQNGLALRYVPKMLRNDKEIVSLALNEDGRSLAFLNRKNRGNEEYINMATSNSLEALNYALVSEEFLGKNNSYLAYMFEKGIDRERDLGQSKKLYKLAAESGDIASMIRLAHLYLEDTTNSNNLDTAYKWFRMAGDLGDPEGLTMLGFMKERALAVNKDILGAKAKYLEALARSLNKSPDGDKPFSFKGGYPKAAYLLGKLFVKKLLRSDEGYGRKWLLIAAEQGHLEAQKLLSSLHFEGIDGPQSLEASFKWIFNAAEQDDLTSRFILALYYELGFGIVDNLNLKDKATEIFSNLKIEGVKGLECLMNGQDSGRLLPQRKNLIDLMKYYADQGSVRFKCLQGSDFNIRNLISNISTKDKLKWLHEAADNGHPEAQIRLAREYREQKKYQISNDWSDKAVALGYARGFTVKGEAYLNGFGYTKNTDDAVFWFKKAANLNEREAQRHLGMMYKMGKGVSKSLSIAHDWFTKAATNGDDEAMVNLGIMYAFGNGVEKDERKAVVWFKKAERLGNKDAKTHLEIMSDQGTNIHSVRLADN